MVLINQKNCNNTIKNLGVPDCIINNGRITGMIAVAPDWTIDTTSGTIDQTTVNDLIQDGTFIPILGAVEVVNGTPEPTTEEYQGGIMSVVRNGLPMFTFKFLKGWAYARALYSLNSFQSYKVLLVFEDGSIAGTVDGTTFSGYSLGMLNTNTYFHTDGSVSGYVNTVIQLTSQDEYNLNTAVIDRSTLGFNANGLFPITSIIMTGRADVATNTVFFKAKFEMNQASNLGGIAIANLKSFVNGVADTIVALSLTYNPSTEEWSYEPTATLTTSDTVVVQLYDATNSIAVAKIGVKYYVGATASITPVQVLPIMTSVSTIPIEEGLADDFQVTAINTPTAFEITVGTLPSGVTLNATTGLISWDTTPVVGDTNVTLKITNAAGFTTNPIIISVT